MAVDVDPRSSTIAVKGGDLEVFGFGRSGELVICAAGNGRPASQRSCC
jgi:hypothetical protein